MCRKTDVTMTNTAQNSVYVTGVSSVSFDVIALIINMVVFFILYLIYVKYVRRSIS